MNKSIPIKIITIMVVLGLALFYLKDSFFLYSKPSQQRQLYIRENPSIVKKIIKLGLDLQGGMRLVLELDRSKINPNENRDVLDRAFTVIENRINGLGVAEPTIQKQGKDRIIVELPGIQDEEQAKQVIGSTAQLEFKFLREPDDLRRAIMAIDNILAGKSITADSASLLTADSTELQRKKAQKDAEALFAGQGQEADSQEGKTVDSAGADFLEEKEEKFSDYLVAIQDQIAVRNEDIFKVKKILSRPDVKTGLEKAGLGGSIFLWGHKNFQPDKSFQAYRYLYFVKSRPELLGDAIKDARETIAHSGVESGQAIVELEMNGKGAQKFARITGANIGKYLAIVLDSTVYSAPVIQEKIPYGRAQIKGSFTVDEARNLAIVLRAGALPAPMNIVEERTVGPSLGQDSIVKGLWALLGAYIFVGLFMIFYYRLSGVIAMIALLLNIILVVAIMAPLGAVLTLPGIAGLILTTGMAVDANVLIFERIREELALGKTPRSAIEAGYKRVFITIFDSNLTTLITAFILYLVGTGAVKGFAVTLIFGIIISFFTAMFVTRLFQDILFERRRGISI